MLRILLVVLLGMAAGPMTSPRASSPRCPTGAPVAFVGASLLTMDSPDLVRDATVLVRDGTIAAIDPATVPAGACTVQTAGRVLMPGLTDMHVHTDASEMPLFLANGVTFVREMNGSPAHLALRDSLARGLVAGPRMLVASPLLAGVPQRWRHVLVTTPEEAYKAAHDAKNAGYDYLKIYDGLSRASYDALVEAGRTLGLPLDGHIPANVGLEHALEVGQYLQHIDKIAFSLAGHRGDSTAYPRARELFAERRAWVTPTLASLRALNASQTTEYTTRLEAPEMAYVDSATFGWWSSLKGSRTRTGPSSFYRFMTGLLPVLRESGARFLLGTDSGNPLMVAGFAVHDEMETLVRDGGFTPWQALASATRNVGAFLGDSLRGRLVVGAPADLILVDGDPLGDLTVLRRPDGVMVNGRWYPREELDSLLWSARKR